MKKLIANLGQRFRLILTGLMFIIVGLISPKLFDMAFDDFRKEEMGKRRQGY